MWLNSQKQISDEPVNLSQRKLQEQMPPGVKIYTKQYQPLTNCKYNIIDNSDSNDIQKIKAMIHEFHHMPTENGHSNQDIPTGVNSNSKENQNQINLSKIPSQSFSQKDLPSQQASFKQLTLTQMEKIDINISNGQLINGITYDDQLCQLQISKSFLEIIRPFNKINFICAIGSAKSTFLNSLLGFPSGQAFYLAKEQGFHIWTAPLYCPVSNSYTYFSEVILSKNNSHFNAQLLILSHLLSSTILLTSKNHLANETFEQLSYLKKVFLIYFVFIFCFQFRNYVDFKNPKTKHHFTQQQLIIVTRKMKFNMSHQEFLWNFLSTIDNELSHKIIKHFPQIYYYSLDIDQLASIWDPSHSNFNNINKVRYQCIQSRYSGLKASMLQLVINQLNQGGQLYNQQAYLGLCNLENLEEQIQEQQYINVYNQAFDSFQIFKNQTVDKYKQNNQLTSLFEIQQKIDQIKRTTYDDLNQLRVNNKYQTLIEDLIDKETYNITEIYKQIINLELQSRKNDLNPHIYLYCYDEMVGFSQFKYVPKLLKKLADQEIYLLKVLQEKSKQKSDENLQKWTKQQMNLENELESMKFFYLVYLEQVKKETVKKNVLIQEIETLEEIKESTQKQQDELMQLANESNQYREQLEKKKQKIGLVILK